MHSSSRRAAADLAGFGAKPLASLDRDRLAAILGMMDSAHDGEALNAAKQATRIVKDARITWPQVINADQAALDKAVELLSELAGENHDLRSEIERLRSYVKPRPPQPWESAEGWQEGV